MCIRATEAGSIEMAAKELHQPRMWSKDVVYLLTTSHKAFVVAWSEFLFQEERIRVPGNISIDIHRFERVLLHQRRVKQPKLLVHGDFPLLGNFSEYSRLHPRVFIHNT